MAEVDFMVVLLLALAAGLAGAAYLVLVPWWAWRPLLARRVVVNLKTGRAISGLLVRRAGDLLFIRDAVVLEPGAEPAPADGSAVVARADIDFIQAL